MPKKRDYRAEYRRRVAKGRAAGKSRQEARGHARGERKAIREAGRERAAKLRPYKEALTQRGKDPSAGLRAKPFKASLQGAKRRGMTGTVVFTFEGKPNEEEISPKLEDQARERQSAFQAVPIRFNDMEPPIPLEEVVADLERWIEEARSKTSLIDPELSDVYVVKRTLRRLDS